MKKTIVLLLLALIVATVPLCVGAEEASEPSYAQTATFYQGEIVVDGTVDEVWEKVPAFDIGITNMLLTRPQNIFVSDTWFKGMYDAEAGSIYFLVHAVDGDLMSKENCTDAAVAFWARDCVMTFFNFNMESPSQEGTLQVDIAGNSRFPQDTEDGKYEFAMTVDEESGEYWLEFAVHVGEINEAFVFEDNAQFTFDIYISDNDGAAGRRGGYCWSSRTGDSTSGKFAEYGLGILSPLTVEEYAEQQAQQTTEADTTDAETPESTTDETPVSDPTDASDESPTEETPSESTAEEPTGNGGCQSVAGLSVLGILAACSAVGVVFRKTGRKEK